MPTTFVGRVLSTKSQKTCMVQICSLVRHPKLKVHYRKYKKIMTHDPEEKTREGDWVSICHSGSNPISKRKRFFLHEILQPVPRDEDYPADPAFARTPKKKPVK